MLVFGISNSAQLIHKPSANDKESGIQYLKSGIRHSLEQNARLSWMTLHRTTQRSPHVRESGFLNPRKFCLWNLQSKVLESGLQLIKSGILGFGIRNTV